MGRPSIYRSKLKESKHTELNLKCRSNSGLFYKCPFVALETSVLVLDKEQLSASKDGLSLLRELSDRTVPELVGLGAHFGVVGER